MTTEPQTTPEGEWVPRYFSDFRKEFDEFKDENAGQHVALGDRISAIEVDTARQFGELRAQMAEDKADTARQFGEFRADMESRFGEVKAQMAEDKADTARQFGEFRAYMESRFGEVKAQMAEDKAEMHRALASQLRWTIGTMGGIGIAVVGSVIYLAERLA